LARPSKRPANTVQEFQPEAGAVPFPGYRLIRLRGRGGFATVWEAEAPDQRLLALKFLSTRDSASTTRELRSFQALQTLSHPHLLQTYQVWSLPGQIVIAMELADASLLDLLLLYQEEFQRAIEPEKLCRYMVQVAHALDFLNGRKHRIDGRIVGLQHGDVKPNNILLIGDQVKLADYGLAAPTSGPVIPCHRHGTLEYCAPEVFTGKLTDWSDQYSFAVTYFVLRTGAFPFPPPPDPTRVSLRNYQRPDPDLSLLSPAERPIVARALSPIPQQRFPSCQHFMSAVLAVFKLRACSEANGTVEVSPE